MAKKQKEVEERRPYSDYTKPDEYKILKKKTIKELIAPSGIDASNIDHLAFCFSDFTSVMSWFAFSNAFSSICLSKMRIFLSSTSGAVE